MLDRIYVGIQQRTPPVPLSAMAHFERGEAPLAVRHQGQFPAATLSFNLAPGMALGDAEAAVQQAATDLRMPPRRPHGICRQREMVAGHRPGPSRC